ncbi:hypothetical protein PSPO01_16442 [Paraphaeosphaeria sporulosa]
MGSPQSPMPIGHEAIGYIEPVGVAVQTLEVGDSTSDCTKLTALGKNLKKVPRRRRKSGCQVGDSRSSERITKGPASIPTKPDRKKGEETGHRETSALKGGLNLPLKDSKENAGLKQKLRELLDDLESLAIASEFVETTLRTKIRATKVLIEALQREITESAAS